MSEQKREYRPLIAIIGSARQQITQAKEAAARAACIELGQELATRGYGIAVYFNNTNSIEPEVVKGYVDSGNAQPDSIVCLHPQSIPVDFPERSAHPDLFRDEIDTSDDWEVSFYDSLEKVDGTLILGGAASTLIAGHFALNRGLPIISVAEFGGTGNKLWKTVSSKSTLIEDEDVQAMASWSPDSAKRCVDSLSRQIERRRRVENDKFLKIKGFQEKAELWDKKQNESGKRRALVIMAVVFLIAFVLLLVLGLVFESSGGWYTGVVIAALGVAGGLGATIRKLLPTRQNVDEFWAAPLIGFAVGVVFGLLFHLPQMIGGTSFVTPEIATVTAEDTSDDEKKLEVSLAASKRRTIQAQYLSAMLVAFVMGLGFDVAIEQLLRRAREKGQEIADQPIS